MPTYNLVPINDSRASFYGKATVTSEGGVDTLTSYSTEVARIDWNASPTVPVVLGTYSATTLRHIKEFLRQNYFKAETKSQILRDYGA